MNDKEIERHRYEDRAKYAMDNSNFNNTNNLTSPLRAPYDFYRKMINSYCTNDSFILEIGAGMGENTEFLLDIGARVCATDISHNSLSVIKSRVESEVNADRLTVKVADMEVLPFYDGLFDVVVSAGSLSYGDHNMVLNEIYRVLKPEGVFISVDSLNNNPIYRLNRYIHYLKGNRSLDVIKRTPDLRLLRKYDKKFSKSTVNFFGSISYLVPLMNKLFGEKISNKISVGADKLISPIKRSAFKFVLVTEK